MNMAYLYCHSCHWSQDDFWDFRVRVGGYSYFYFIKWPVRVGWGYNPFSAFLSEVFGWHGYWRPRRVDYDDYCAKDNGWGRRDPHSWWLIGRSFRCMIRNLKSQRWRTYDEFKRDPDKRCPRCGSDDLDID